MENIIDWLKQNPSIEWDTYGEGDTEENIAAAEKNCGLQFPQDYKDLLRFSRGCSMGGKHERIELHTVDEAESLSEEPDNMLYIPGMFIIGGDGGGNFYYFDPQNLLGRGAYAVYHCSMGALSYKYSVFVGSSLRDAIKRIGDGLDFSECEYLEHEGEVPEVKKFQSQKGIQTMEDLLTALPREIQHPRYGKGELKIEESKKRDGSPHISGGYHLQDTNIVYFTWSGTYQGLYNAMAPQLFIKGLI